MESGDGNRTSPRSTKGQRPKCHSEEYQREKGKKSGSVAKKRQNMAGKSKPMGKKGPVGSKGRPLVLVLGTSSESNDSSLDDEDDDSSEKEQPKKKSRVYANPKGTSSKGAAKTSQVVMQKGGKASAVTTKMTKRYGSDENSSSKDSAICNRKSHLAGNVADMSPTCH
jgi:hypothetical protein